MCSLPANLQRYLACSGCEVLVCEMEPNNFQDRYAVAVKKENSAHLMLSHKATCENILTVKITQTRYQLQLIQIACQPSCSDEANELLLKQSLQAKVYPEVYHGYR